MSNWREIYEEWLDKADDDLQEALRAMDEEEQKDAFGSELAFGTAGLRGILGPGTNRMNRHIIQKTTEGLARWVENQGPEAKQAGVVISYDNRHYSQEFAYEAASVLGAHGIQSYVFDELTPTPVLSFSVRELGTIAGIMITASHNPPNYNGYKVYGKDGGQFPPEAADSLSAIIAGLEDPFAIEPADVDELKNSGLLKVVGDDLRQAYLAELKSVNVNPGLAKEAGDQVSFTYSAMHGTGYKLVKQALDQAGYTNIHYVESQCQPDPNFSTVESPNPEVEEPFDLSKDLADQVDADLLFATDPDADRLGVLVRLDATDYYLLSGNQVASLMFDYLCQHGELAGQPALIRSIVSTHLVDEIAKDYGVEVFEVLTGFKFVADKIGEFEASGDNYSFVMGFEEAIGYLIQPFVRDKDAIQAIVLMAEVATYHQQQGRNLIEALEELYQKYGYHFERTISVMYPGLSGQDKMKQIMAEVRQADLEVIGGQEVVKIEDYLTLEAKFADGRRRKLDYDSSNVLRYTLADGSWIALRPSGTEPKIKLYMSGVSSESMEKAQAKVDAIEADMRVRIE